ncbi:MAG: hypothetical protein WA708_14250 [Acidobacteriaceae bacterium]
MTLKSRFATIMILFTFFGCKESVQTSAASAVDGASSSSAGGGAKSASASDGGTRMVPITDPTLNNMTAFEVTVPAKWHVQGALFQGQSCDTMPYLVFRASSPDGLSYVEHLPALSWAWGSGPMAQKNQGSCLPLQRAMGAQQFLRYLAATMKVDYVAEVPIPAEQNAALQRTAHASDKNLGIGMLKNSSEAAAAIVRYKNGTFTMKGLLSAVVTCHETDLQGRRPMFSADPGGAPSETHQCTAGVRYLVAPEAQYERVKKIWDSPDLGGKPLMPWFQAFEQRQQQIANVSLRQRERAQDAAQQAQQQRFEQSMALQQHMHEQFMATMQRGTDMSMEATQQNMNARSTATSDWVDYALDQRTVADPNTGQISKVSNAYNYTWVDSTGKMSYQTDVPNANPNGVLPGNWTKQTVVHGDGSQ